MPRQPRLLLSQSYYHIMTRGNNKHIIFKNDEDYSYYLSLIKRFKEQLPFDLYHYCLMPNHTHFLIKTQKAKDFSNFMKRLDLAYYHYFNKKYKWVGHFWQNRFKSQAVGKDEYFIQCGKYIELNPVRSELVKNPNEYKYSSYNYYFQGEFNSLITQDFIFESLHDEPHKRREIYNKMIVDEIILESYKSKVWGETKQQYLEQQKISRNIY